MTALPPGAPVLVRTWFGDDHAWAQLVSSVQSPSEEGFLADVLVIDDPTFEGLTPEALEEMQTNGPIVSFLADEVTLSSSEQPIMAVWVLPREADDDRPEPIPFRVLPSELWSVENNINLANMDWHDFTGAVDDDGVFRGF